MQNTTTLYHNGKRKAIEKAIEKANKKREVLLPAFYLTYAILFSFTVNWLFLRAAAFLCRMPRQTAWSIFLTATL
jgi:hypothetical protein